MYEVNVALYLENEQIIYFPLIATTITFGEYEISLLLVTENSVAMQRTIEVLIASGMLYSVSPEYLMFAPGYRTPPKFTLMMTIKQNNSSYTLQFDNCLFSNRIDYNRIMTGEDNIELEVISLRSPDKQVIQY